MHRRILSIAVAAVMGVVFGGGTAHAGCLDFSNRTKKAVVLKINDSGSLRTMKVRAGSSMTCICGSSSCTVKIGKASITTRGDGGRLVWDGSFKRED